jgi:HAMP domain-containing protein
MAETTSPQKPGLQNDYPAQIFSAEGYHPPEYVAYLDRAAAAVHSLKFVVLGILAIAVVLAAYGFFLLYQLTRDSHRMVEHTAVMAEQMVAMERAMASMRTDIGAMRGNMGDMRDGIASLSRSVASIESSVGHMASTVGLIQHSTANLDRSFGPAMGMLNNVMPFGWGGNNWGGAPPYAAPPQAQPR